VRPPGVGLTGRYPAIASAVDALAPSLSETHALKYWCCPHPVPQALRLGGSVRVPIATSSKRSGKREIYWIQGAAAAFTTLIRIHLDGRAMAKLKPSVPHAEVHR
jgi:hypothetical protein